MIAGGSLFDDGAGVVIFALLLGPRFRLPRGPAREIVLVLTCCVVVLSILAQRLPIGWLVRRVVESPQTVDP